MTELQQDDKCAKLELFDMVHICIDMGWDACQIVLIGFKTWKDTNIVLPRNLCPRMQKPIKCSITHHQDLYSYTDFNPRCRDL